MKASWLHIPYLLNIIILVPVCYQMFWGQGERFVFEGKVGESSGLRLLVASLWSAILFCSLAALFFPIFFMPIILAQIFYKAMWLTVYCVPKWRIHGAVSVPWGISFVFLAICTLYPVFVYLHLSSGGVI